MNTMTSSAPRLAPATRTSTGVPFGRLIAVELRKMLDTRAGRWLLVGIGAAILTALVILFFVDGGHHPFRAFLQATTMPQALILPVVGILAVTSEWSQRTGLVTYTLEPRRMRVAWAKIAVSLIVGVAALVLAFGLAALVHVGSMTLRGNPGNWTITGLVVLGASLYVLLGMLQGIGFGMLFRNTPAAIVVYFALPTVWSILTSMISGLDTAARWLDFNQTMEPLFTGAALTGEQWAHLGTSVGLWVVLPLAIGLWRLSRAEVK